VMRCLYTEPIAATTISIRLIWNSNPINPLAASLSLA
jgi:hypothetical protein